jgi:hypothetical protein
MRQGAPRARTVARRREGRVRARGVADWVGHSNGRAAIDVCIRCHFSIFTVTAVDPWDMIVVKYNSFGTCFGITVWYAASSWYAYANEK